MDKRGHQASPSGKTAQNPKVAAFEEFMDRLVKDPNFSVTAALIAVLVIGFIFG